MAANPLFIANVKNAVAQIQNADGTNLVSLVTPGATGSRVHSINCASDDTVARVIQLWATISAVDYLLGEVNIPIGAGSDGATKPVKVLNQTDFPFLRSDGVNVFLDVMNGATLKVKSKTVVTAGKKLQFFAEYGDI
jgi:hypothetical protein